MAQNDTFYDRATQRRLQQRLLDVRALRSTADHSRFWWMVRDIHGQLIETSPATYASETEARRAADAAARSIRRRFA